VGLVSTDVAIARAPAPLRPAQWRVAGVVAVAAAGAVFALGGASGWSAVEAATAALLVWVAAIDAEMHLLPNRLLLPATGLVLAASALADRSSFAEHAIWMVVAGGFFALAAVMRPRDLGMGDVKLVLLLGALLGRDVLPALAIGFCLVAAAGLVLLVRYGRPALRRYIPLGPFIAAGAVAILLLSGSH
jgi:leader peptidase (prepilin peptidase) / N-methyltransferase